MFSNAYLRNMFSQYEEDDTVDRKHLYTIAQSLNVKNSKENEVQIDDVIDLLQITNKANYKQFSHFVYVLSKAQLNDAATILFYVSDTEHTQKIDREDLYYILKFLNLEATQDQVNNLFPIQQEFIEFPYFYHLITMMRQEHMRLFKLELIKHSQNL